MAGVKTSKGKKMQAAAAKRTTRTVKGRNTAPKLARQDKKKGAAKRRKFKQPEG